MKWVALLAFGGVGLAALAAGVVWGARRYSLYKSGVRTNGVVVEVSAHQSTTTREGRTVDSTSYYPVVEFTPADGKTRRFTGSTGSGSPSYSAGQSVAVIYDPADPAKAQLADFEQFWLGPLAVSLFGLFFLAGGVGGYFLVADSDKTFGPAFHARMARGRLYDLKKGLRLKGAVKSVREEYGEWVLVCEASAPGGAPREFLAAPLGFDPGRVVGKPVEVYVDPQDAASYYVHVDPLFASDAP